MQKALGATIQKPAAPVTKHLCTPDTQY